MEDNNIHAIFRELCPNCGGPVTDQRLENRLPCQVCLPSTKTLRGAPDNLSTPEYVSYMKDLVLRLEKRGRVGRLGEVVKLEEELSSFIDFFEKAVGSRPWSAQVTWARRVLKGSSFAVLAPTGVGKTVFGLTMSLYLASKGGKVYLVLPTTTLLGQVYDKALQFASRVGFDRERIMAYHGGLSPKEREEVLDRVSRGDYSVLLTTAQFLARNFEYLKGARFDFVFVDDVDSVLKSSKNIDRILVLLGFSEEEISTALELVTLRARMLIMQRNRKHAENNADELEKLQSKLESMLARSGKKGVLVVSTATGRARGQRVKLFRELLGFEVGSRSEQLRNVLDVYALSSELDLTDKAVELVSTLGPGGLVFFPIGTPEDKLAKMVERLAARGLKAEYVYGKAKRNLLERFSSGEVGVLVGVASYYGLLVRGLDLPHVVKYAVFVGVPRFKFRLVPEELTPNRLLQLASNLVSIVEKGDAVEINRLVANIRSRILQLDASQYRTLQELYMQGVTNGRYAFLVKSLLRLRDLVVKYLSDPSVLERLSEETTVKMFREEGQYYVILPDVYTYLQASGRTSRLYAGGISKGLSIILENDAVLLEKFFRAIRFYTGESQWKKLEEVDLGRIMEEVSREREVIKAIIEGRASAALAKDLVKSVLVIVESPTKAKTIASFFGKPNRRRMGSLFVYETTTGNRILQIVASQGHVYDLITSTEFFFKNYSLNKYGVLVNPEKNAFVPVFTSLKKCLDCGRQFTDYKADGNTYNVGGKGSTLKRCPYCGSDRVVDKMDLVLKLQDLAYEVDEVLLATDPDTEGEKIAWDIYVTLKPFTRVLRRIEFHEITRKAFQEALDNPRDVNMNLVKSQFVRRIEDRWVGFALSKKLQENFGMTWLSAGRVQTPVLGWVIDRYRESMKSVRPVFKVVLENNVYLIIEDVQLDGKRPSIVAKALQGSEVIVEEKATEEKLLNPPPPYTTDTMLRDANELLGMSADVAMRVAQQLFESGLITYHRTDSTRVSDAGINVARTYISEKFGSEMFTARRWGSEGAHECIRPTRPIDAETLSLQIQQGVIQLPIQLTRQHFALYRLIFSRFMASQMMPARVKEKVVEVKSEYFAKEYRFVAGVVEEGFLKVQPLRQAFRLEPGRYRVVDVDYKRRPLIPLYSQADIVGLMKEKNIGRPSTYAEIIRKLFARNYVIEVKGGKLVPTNLGQRVYQFLYDNFRDYISEDTTKNILERMDEVEKGERDYRDVLKEFYGELLKIEETRCRV
ncbi:MAG: reverse gyrase [Infirmifilum sp.]|uniref:reverse gyrase n=1 Tax=Infirmifilum TaxID=2856573 RepID=UPI0023565A9D